MSPRRIRWTVRALVLGLLGLLAAGALALRAEEPVADLVLDGRTSQGAWFEMRTNAAGAVHSFTTVVHARCPGGEERTVQWSPPASDATYRRDGERLIVHERWDKAGDGWRNRGWARLEGRVATDGGAASGVMSVESRVSEQGGGAVTCRAANVGWRAR